MFVKYGSARHELELRGRRRRRERIAADAGRPVELLEDRRGWPGSGRTPSVAVRERDVVREPDPLRDRGVRRLLELGPDRVKGKRDPGQAVESPGERRRADAKRVELVLVEPLEHQPERVGKASVAADAITSVTSSRP